MKSLVKGLLGLAVLGVLSGFVVRKRVPSFGTPDDSRFGITAAFGGGQFASLSDDLLEANALAYCGGIQLDLTDSTPAPGAVLHLKAVCGGIDVVVPETWRVEVAAKETFGEVANLTNPDAATGPLVIVDAHAVMGGIAIRPSEAAHGR